MTNWVSAALPNSTCNFHKRRKISLKLSKTKQPGVQQEN